VIKGSAITADNVCAKDSAEGDSYLTSASADNSYSITYTVNLPSGSRNVYTEYRYSTIDGKSSTSTYDVDCPPNPPTDIQTEGLTNPTRLTTFIPKFSSIYTDNDAGENATDAQVRVGTSQGDNSLWQSAWVDIADIENNTRCENVTYAGSDLSRGITYYVGMRFKDSAGNEGYWSTESATFRLNQLPLTENLEIENENAPTRLTTFTPTFAWDYSDPDADDQENYQIKVGASLGDNSMWDNTGGALISITYSGAALSRGTTYYASVRTYDNYEWSSWENDNFRLNQLPTCSITAPPNGYDTTAGTGIRFTSSASDPDGDSLTYLWDFGDGNASALENVSHTYGNPGDYTVTLVVNDGYENSSTDSIVVNVGALAGGGGGGIIPVVKEVVKAIEPARNVLFKALFTLGALPIQVWMILVLIAVIAWNRDMKGVSYSALLVLFFLIWFGSKLL